MPDSHSPAVGRRLFPMAALFASLALAACQTGGSVGTSGGASSSGVSYLTEIRTSHGLPPLAYDVRLEKAALQQAAFMARSGRMEHTTGWGRDFGRRMKKNGVDAPAAENIAQGRMDMDRLFSMWMDSSGHRKNMLDPRFNRFGLAYAGEANGRKYWALVVGR